MRQIMTITEAAAKQVQNLIDSRGKPTYGVRVGVDKGGCSGLSYKLEFVDEKQSFDEEVTYQFSNEESAIHVLIDPKAVMYLIGTQMDYVEEQMKSGFTFKNPNEKARCGCGESFSV
ncbi:MAG: iron-sulfur cluster assembly accessory protein [Alphaproteobacteria bacterium]|nr:iron-sulfur cluster assembly accessory protein [Alphaproteobacteria bacterium]